VDDKNASDSENEGQDVIFKKVIRNDSQQSEGEEEN
jgi:hypothetical protein